LAPSKDIEDQFANAVKSALGISAPVDPPSEAEPASGQASRTSRRRVWGIALLCLALVAIAIVVVAAVLHVRGADLSGMATEILATGPVGADSQTEATAVAPEASSAPESMVAATSPTIAATTEAPTAAVTASAAATAGAFAATPASASTAAATASPAGPTALEESPAAQALKVPALAPTVPVTGRRASAARITAEMRQPVAHPSAPSRRSKVSRPALRRTAPSKQPSVIASIAAAEKASAPAVSAPATRSVLVSSTDHSVYWAFEDSGTIFHSTDRKSWKQQDSGVQADLVAGHAVSNTVCWAVGRAGTILLTTDGTRWERIKSPTNKNLVSISAASADVADIVAADGSRFSTFDRGSNWQPSD
jgi:hypothetical protein